MLVAILGAGPAGMSCANACASFGLHPLVIERSGHPGGAQRNNFHPNLWMLGYPEESGEDMTRRLEAHFRRLEAPMHFHARVSQVTRPGKGFHITLDTLDTPLKADALVLATGTRPRGTPAFEALARECGRVIVGPVSHAIRDEIHDARVLILGGGDNALDHALYLTERGNRVDVRTRGHFSARKPFIEACLLHPAIELHGEQQAPTASLRGGRLVARWPGREREYDWLLVMYGYLPATDVLQAFAPELRPHTTPAGYIRTDSWQRTNVPRLYAAGDVTEPAQPSVPTALAQGLTAARAAEKDLGDDS